MKTLPFRRIVKLLCIGLLSSSFLIGQPGQDKKKTGNSGTKSIGKWEMLGEKEVDRVKEWDVFYAKGNGIYAAFKLKVLYSRVKFEKMVIEYDNGRKQSVDLNKEIPENGESRVIDVIGERRKIKSISFRYSTRGIFNDKAKVQVWGRK